MLPLPAALAALALLAPPPESAGAPAPAAPAATPAGAVPPSGSTTSTRLSSVVGARSFGAGGAAWALGLGFPYAFAAYAQGTSARDDLGGSFEVDWAASEFLLSGFWRREIGRWGDWYLGLRVGLGFYACSGGTWFWSDNRSDRGLRIAPALAWSLDTGSGLLTFGGEVPTTWTFPRGGGWILAPRLVAGFETPLWPDLSLGARAGAGVRAAGGGAAGAGSDRTVVELTMVATYRPF